MEYLNLSITQLSAPDFRRSSMPDRGIWLTLLGYCVQQENAGRIENVHEWTDDECRYVIGVSRLSLDGDHHLWAFDTDGALHVHGYPHSAQQAQSGARERGRILNDIRWSKKQLSDADSMPDSAAKSKRITALTEKLSAAESALACLNNTTGLPNGIGKGKGMVRKGQRKGKGMVSTAPAVADSTKPSAIEDVEAYASEIQADRSEASVFFDHFEANGWRQGGRTPLRDWKAAFRNWVRRSGTFGGSPGRQKNRGGLVREGENPNGGLQIFNDGPVAPAAGGGA